MHEYTHLCPLAGKFLYVFLMLDIWHFTDLSLDRSADETVDAA